MTVSKVSPGAPEANYSLLAISCYRKGSAQVDPEVHLCFRRGSRQGDDVCVAVTVVNVLWLTSCFSWGQSAGAQSVAFHMLANGGNTEGLFRAGFMESGSPPISGTVDNPVMQSTYDQIVQDAGCANTTDTIQCLRTIPAETLKAAMDHSPSFVDFNVRSTCGRHCRCMH